MTTVKKGEEKKKWGERNLFVYKCTYLLECHHRILESNSMKPVDPKVSWKQ